MASSNEIIHQLTLSILCWLDSFIQLISFIELNVFYGDSSAILIEFQWKVVRGHRRRESRGHRGHRVVPRFLPVSRFRFSPSRAASTLVTWKSGCRSIFRSNFIFLPAPLAWSFQSSKVKCGIKPIDAHVMPTTLNSCLHSLQHSSKFKCWNLLPAGLSGLNRLNFGSR